MIEANTIATASRLLRAAAPPGSEIILFGSYATGHARPDSDLDFLVIEPEVTDQHREMVRLRQVLRPLRVPADIVVTSRRAFSEWKDTPNNILHAAACEGRRTDEVG